MKQTANVLNKGGSISIKACSFALLFLLPGLGVNAQQRDTIYKLNEVKVVFQNLPQIQTVTPSQQITSKDFSKYAALTVADIANNFAGVNVRDYGGIGGLKTVSVRSLGASHTGVLYDGILLDDAQNGQIDLGKFNLYNIQSIALYNGQLPVIVQPARAFATASILDIKTVYPQLTISKPFQIMAGFNGGSFGLVNPYLQWQQRISNRWSVVLNGNYTTANGRYKYKENADGSDTLATRKNGNVGTWQTDGALYWIKSDSNRFKIQYNYYNTDQGLPGPVILYLDGSHQYLQNEDALVQSTYEYTAKNSLHLLFNGKYSQDYVHYTDPDFLNNSGGLNEHYTEHEFYGSAAVGYHILPQWELSYSSDMILTNLFADVYQYAFPTRLTLLNALATNVFIGKLQLQGSLLHTYINDEVKSGTAAASRSILSPTLSASIKPFKASGLQLRAFYKNIFRNPTFSEQYYYAVLPRNLKPEQVNEFDLGATYQKAFDGVLSNIALTADGYYNNIRNKIIYLPTRSPLTPSVTNLGRVDITGVDVTARADFKPAPYWRANFSATYTYQNAVDVTNPTDSYYLQQIPYTPKNLLTLDAGFSYKRIGMYYNCILSSSRYFESDNVAQYYLAGYNVSNLSFNYSLLTQRHPLNIAFNINNLFNTSYVIVHNYPMPGLSYRISMQITI